MSKQDSKAIRDAISMAFRDGVKKHGMQLLLGFSDGATRRLRGRVKSAA